MTAHHVLEAQNLYVIYKNEAKPGRWSPPNSRLHLPLPDADKTTVQAFDLGLLSVEPEKEPYPALPLSDRTDFDTGESIGVYGFFDTGAAYKVMGKEYVTSLLTSGIVSGQFKLGDATEDVGSRLILVTAGPGSSGSPVFELKSGKVWAW